MRIPTSVIVMSLVTAAPFALAVRDTLHPQPKHHSYDDDEITPEAETAQYEAEMRRMEEERQANEARKRTVYKGLLGDKGKLGSYLDNLSLDTPLAQADAVHTRTETANDIIELDLEETATGLNMIQIHAVDCDALEEAVRGAWGDANQWLDPATHTRTVFDSIGCSLKLTRYTEIEQFVDKTSTASIPLGLIGKPIDGIANTDDGNLRTPGLANTSDVLIRLTSDDNNQKVVGFSASFQADVDADATIRARLDKLLGKGKQDPDTGEWDWKGKVPVHYAYSDAHVYLDIGAP